jgi:hypothetical protein
MENFGFYLPDFSFAAFTWMRSGSGDYRRLPLPLALRVGLAAG